MENFTPQTVQADRRESTSDLFAGLSGRYCAPATGKSLPYAPLIVAIHGGTYTSNYFDLPGFSLLDLASQIGVPIIALDRPGYGTSAALEGAAASIESQARFLTQALKEAWKTFGADTRGIVLIGHSIGGAIATSIAAQNDPDLPIIGLAISGVGLHVPSHFPALWASYPDTPTVELPHVLKNEVMFGPEGSYNDVMPSASHAAHSPAPRQELIDIVTTWIENVREIVARVKVPVHYRQGEFDKLWIVNQEEVRDFAKAFRASPSVDASLVKGTGHCIDLHNVGTAFHLQQLGFAVLCAV